MLREFQAAEQAEDKVRIEALSSSDAAATVSTLIEASPEAFPATWTRSLVWREIVDRPAEVVRIWPEASPS